jgi:hypothetical protein
VAAAGLARDPGNLDGREESRSVSEGVLNWAEPDELVAMLAAGWVEVDRQDVGDRIVVRLHSTAEKVETMRSLRKQGTIDDCPLTLDELREMVLDVACDWLVWGKCLDSFLDGGPLASSLHWGSRTAPGEPSITLSRKAAGGHRGRIIHKPELGEIVFTWTQVRRELRLGRAGEQLDLLGAVA